MQFCLWCSMHSNDDFNGANVCDSSGRPRQHYPPPPSILLLLFLWLFPSSGVAAMVVDHLFPVSPVSCIALSQSYSLHVPLVHILPPCLWSPSLPFPRYRFRHHSLHYVILFHPHDVPIPFQSSLRYLSGRLRYFRRSSDVFVPDFVFSCHSTHPPQHPHLVHPNP